MRVSIEEKKEEAIRRMRELGIYPETRKQFERYGLISESIPPVGACFWIEGEQLDRVRDFEQKNNALVYFVIHSYTDYGEIENYLYVSDYKEDWEMDHMDMKDGYQCVYAYNHDMPDCSELGTIAIRRTPAAGLERVC